MTKMVHLIDVLLVEDNETDALMVRESFKEARVANNFHIVPTGEEALSFLHRRGQYAAAPRPDLVLLDLNLPGMSGQEVLAEVKGDDVLKVTPVIVLTTSAAEEDIVTSYGLQANSYVTKPVGFDNLREALRAMEDFWFGIVALPPRAK